MPRSDRRRRKRRRALLRRRRRNRRGAPFSSTKSTQVREFAGAATIGLSSVTARRRLPSLRIKPTSPRRAGYGRPSSRPRGRPFPRFLDVMRGEHDGDAFGAQAPHQRHVAAQFDVDAGGRFVEGRECRACGSSALAIITRRFMPPDNSMMRSVLRRPDRAAAVRHSPDRPACQGAANVTVLRTVAKISSRDFLRDWTDTSSRLAKIVARRAPRPERGRRQGTGPADDADERRLAGAVGPSSANISPYRSRGRRHRAPRPS